MLEQMYGLDFAIKSFAVDNEFVERMNQGCYQLGLNLQPFCFMADKTQSEWGVLDIAKFNGFVNSDTTLFDEIVKYRRDLYESFWTSVLPNDETVSKALFIDYLLSISICYVEVPKWITKNGVKQKTFDKFFATRNPYIMSAWMGYPANEMQAKYSAKIQQANVDFMSGQLRAVKLTYSAKGNSISVPRSVLNATEMTCIPLFMLYAFTNGFYEKLKQGIIKFTYLKDNDTIRELNSTINFEILTDYYSDNNFISGMLSGVDVFTQDQGGMKLGSKQSRGYIKLPELGCSKYDFSGVRSLNISRILRMENVSEVDRTFIDVDLNSVVDSFKEELDRITVSNPDWIPRIYQLLNINDGNVEGKSVISLQSEINSYIDTGVLIMSTAFKRSLHLFMIRNADMFPRYTGKPSSNSAVKSSKNFGVETMDF